MKLGRLAVASLAVSVGLGSMAEAGNGSNYIHMINGIDYFFGTAPYTGPAGLRGTWRCFPGDNLHSPTQVTDPGSPVVGQYATKICAVHQSVSASPGFTVVWPNITLSTSDGKCHFLASSGTAVNFAVASTGAAGFAVIGPLTGQGAPATISGAWVIGGSGFTNPFSAPNIIVATVLNLIGLFGSPSAIPVPDGESLTLWHADPNNQAGAGTRMYYTGSLDERNICSGYSFLLSGGAGSALTAIGFNSAWEWATGIGTVDATMTNVVSVGASGGGPSGLNAHASTTAFAQPYDPGTGAMTVSVTGTTPFAATSSAGDILGYQTYDESNPFGGANRLIFLNLWKLNVLGLGSCVNGGTANPNVITLGTGGPGGPQLSPLGTKPRVVGQLDTISLTLASNPIWTGATIHGTVAGGNNIPWFPAAAGIGGSTGNTGGFAIPVPAIPQIIGVKIGRAHV